MFQAHLNGITKRIKSKTAAKVIDHWNNQLANYPKENIFPPCVYVDFGAVTWQRTSGQDIKRGKAEITVHCVSADYRETREGAPDDDGKRLKRFDWMETVLAALNNYSCKDDAGNHIFTRLQFIGSAADTNHDALKDDTLKFTTQLYYYGVWREKNWIEVTLQGVDDVYDNTI